MAVIIDFLKTNQVEHGRRNQSSCCLVVRGQGDRQSDSFSIKTSAVSITTPSATASARKELQATEHYLNSKGYLANKDWPQD